MSEYIYVQVRAVEAERPIHAVAVVVDYEDTSGEPYLLDTKSVCERLTAETMVGPTVPFAPFVNTEVEHRCATCEYRLARERLGLLPEVRPAPGSRPLG